MKALVMAICLFMTALSSAFGEILTPVIQDVSAVFFIFLYPPLADLSLSAISYLDLGSAHSRSVHSDDHFLVQVSAPRRRRLHDLPRRHGRDGIATRRLQGGWNGVNCVCTPVRPTFHL